MLSWKLTICTTYDKSPDYVLEVLSLILRRKTGRKDGGLYLMDVSIVWLR